MARTVDPWCYGHAAHGDDRWRARRKLIGVSTSAVGLAIERRIAVAIVAIEKEAVGIAVVPAAMRGGHDTPHFSRMARLVAKLFKALGVLSQGHLVEVDRSKLVEGYIGSTGRGR